MASPHACLRRVTGLACDGMWRSWEGMIRERAMMVMTVFGNIVTSWSWFGTNMLGIGFHSYGFTDAAFLWLSAFMTTQVLVMCLGLIRERGGESHRMPKEGIVP